MSVFNVPSPRGICLQTTIVGGMKNASPCGYVDSHGETCSRPRVYHIDKTAEGISCAAHQVVVRELRKKEFAQIKAKQKRVQAQKAAIRQSSGAKG